MNENELAKIAVDICFKIHTQYGAGLFENVYEKIFCYEWQKTGFSLKNQHGVAVIHEGVNMGIGFIPDAVIGEKVILEFKSVETLADVHYKQVLTYLKLTNLKLGLLINFNVPLIKNGIHRIVNNL
jgi:GxxExxY protein